jgi:hypothetical protein
MVWQAGSVIAVLLLLWFFIRLNRNTREPRVNITRRKQLLEPHAAAFRRQLSQALEADFEIFSQVSLAELFLCDAARDRLSRHLCDRIERTSADFVLVDRDSGTIRCVVALAHHDHPGPRQRFIKQVCDQGKLPYLQFDEHNALSDKDIQQKVKTLLEPTIIVDEPATDDVKVYLEPGREHQRD